MRIETTMAPSTFTRIGIWAASVVILLVHGAPCEAKQSDSALSGPPQSRGNLQYVVGDRVPQAVRLDDEGGPGRRYGILIIEGSVVVIIDRETRVVVQIMR